VQPIHFQTISTTVMPLNRMTVCPDDEMLAGAPELRLHVGVTVGVEPSLMIALAVYWLPLLF
jgi:hypothetical protein